MLALAKAKVNVKDVEGKRDYGMLGKHQTFASKRLPKQWEAETSWDWQSQYETGISLWNKFSLTNQVETEKRSWNKFR